MSHSIDAVLQEGRRRMLTSTLLACLGLSVIVLAFYLCDLFNIERYRDVLRTFSVLLGDSLPPDFSRWHKWGRPLLDTLAMSVSGTVLGCLAALPLSVLAARNMVPSRLGGLVRLFLNTLRSIPGVVWGVIFVAAVGFGPLPGVFALACHSTGMLGKFYAEILEHVDPAPGDALRSHGVSWLGGVRFSILPQILPRLIDVTLYRWEHNVRAATVLGLVGAGGIGLEIMTAFNLFEYREALALIMVLLAMVTVINVVGGRIRGLFLGSE
ncbi:MAG TPA: phosphonate ABC transporter, permease protein PhnE [Patescibacteria group bacterium]|nr:phosphonate ABC transporter, permease protein PhnE [Patescibacteria group bacterium]